jgi:hypothetical protein
MCQKRHRFRTLTGAALYVPTFEETVNAQVTKVYLCHECGRWCLSTGGKKAGTKAEKKRLWRERRARGEASGT